MNFKKLTATLTLTVMMATSLVAPAFADDTESVDAPSVNHYALAQAMNASQISSGDNGSSDDSSDNGASDDTANLGYDYITLDTPAQTIDGQTYLPLRATYAAMKGAALDVEYKPNNQYKIQLKGTTTSYELYLSQDESTLSTQEGSNTYTIKRVDNVMYVPIDLFKDTISTSSVELSGNKVLVLKANDGKNVWTDSFWSGMNTYTETTVTPTTPEENKPEVTHPDVTTPDTDNTTTDKPTDGTLAANIVNYALSFQGVPYVWGGTSPSGFDCSGLVQYVYAQYGISLPRVTYDQQAVATPVSLVSLQPGDLVFWGVSAYHVGIYIGNGQYVHAPAPGQSVKIQSYSEYPYTSGGRVL